MKRTLLVIGGAGYIRSHSCKSLTAVGYTPVVVDNLVSGHADAVNWGPLEVCEILAGPALNKVFGTTIPAAVVPPQGGCHRADEMIDPGLLDDDGRDDAEHLGGGCSSDVARGAGRLLMVGR